MTLVRYEPWDALNRCVALLPRVDVHEEAERYVVEADLPGIAPDDIEVTTELGVLTIRAQRRSAKRDGVAARAETQERSAGQFLRRFTLPDDADPARISARCLHGVLELAIAKQAKVQPRRISVAAA